MVWSVIRRQVGNKAYLITLEICCRGILCGPATQLKLVCQFTSASIPFSSILLLFLSSTQSIPRPSQHHRLLIYLLLHLSHASLSPACVNLFLSTMISRTSSKRLEAALALSSRQALPRPARLSRPYSSPSKRANAPALATAHAPPSASYPAYMPTPDTEHCRLTKDMQAFLRRPIQYTLLPTPLPDDSQSPENSMYFSDSSTQDQLSVMDACLHNFHDVHRAKSVFERLRSKSAQIPLEPKIYNAFLEAYVELANREDSQRSMWMDEAWALFEVMESGAEKVIPTKSTYAVMLLAWYRYVICVFFSCVRPLLILVT
jgi:hypothetical protein